MEITTKSGINFWKQEVRQIEVRLKELESEKTRLGYRLKTSPSSNK